MEVAKKYTIDLRLLDNLELDELCHLLKKSGDKIGEHTTEFFISKIHSEYYTHLRFYNDMWLRSTGVIDRELVDYNTFKKFFINLNKLD